MTKAPKKLSTNDVKNARKPKIDNHKVINSVNIVDLS